MDKQRIVLVRAKHKTDDGHATHDEPATGYFISANLVLTVAHIRRSRDTTFSVRSTGVTNPWCDAVVVWQGADDVDALLLRTRRRFTQWDPLPLEPSSEEGEWKSSGYARTALDERSGARNTQPVAGTFGLSEGQLPTTIDLTTHKHLSEAWRASWKGLSGAPVFHVASDKLVGIIIEGRNDSPNTLVGLPINRILDDETFHETITSRSRLPDRLPDRPFCLVLTAEGGSGTLVKQVRATIFGNRKKTKEFRALLVDPVELPVLAAVDSPENWAHTVRALAEADYLVADVSGFAPAVMLVLGVRAVLRRGVTVSVTRDRPDKPETDVPFNVQETRVLSYTDKSFHKHLYRAMQEGITELQRDRNYLDLPAYHAVRTPRSELRASEEAVQLLMLCPFNASYTAFFDDDLLSVIELHTGGMEPIRMLDLRSPRLVGQALYESIRWTSHCVVDWSDWRPNIFFELGVRLACSQRDPLCIIDDRSATAADPSLQQKLLLLDLLRPVEYKRADPRAGLGEVLEAWSAPTDKQGRTPPGDLPPSATFATAEASFSWDDDPLLWAPHRELEHMIETIVHDDPDQHPERKTLFSGHPPFDAALGNAVCERWIAAWLYLRHRAESDGPGSGAAAEHVTLASLAGQFLRRSEDPRHKRIWREMKALTDDEPTDVGHGEGDRR